VTGAAVKEAVVEKASALFVEPDLVLVLLDPAKEAIERVAGPLVALKEKAHVIIYFTTPGFDVPPELGAVRIAVEKEKEKRFKEKVLAHVRSQGKKMTDKAYALLKERVRDETLLDGELAKLVAYVGEKGLIETKDVAAIVTEIHEEDFITLSDAMARKDRKEVMILAIHGFMTRHVRLLLQARDAAEFFKGVSDFRAFSKDFGKLKEDLVPAPLEKRQYLAFQKPYYAYNLCKSGRRMDEKALLSLLQMLARFDHKVKKGTRHDRTNFEAGLLGA
jgi:DNA polymerase III delta subunit